MLSELYLETKSNPCWKRDQIFLIFTKDFSRGVIFSPYPTHKRRTNLYSSSQIDKMIIWCLHFTREKPPLSNNNTISLLPLYIQHLRSLESYVYMEHNNRDFLITFINIAHESWYFYISLQEKCHLHLIKSEFWNLDVFNIKAFQCNKMIFNSFGITWIVFSYILQT